MIAHSIENANEFWAAEMKFEEILRWLSSKESHRMVHSEVENQLQEQGMELLRLMYQAHLDNRGMGEMGESVQGQDGVIRTHKRERSHKLKSVFGTVEVRRLAYSARGAESLHPKDGQLNLPKEIHSHTVRRIVAKESAKGSFEEVVAAVDDYTGTHVGKRQAEDLVQKAAQDFDAFYQSRSVSSAQQEHSTGPILVLTSDSKGVVVRKEDLREATRKAAEKDQKKLQKRLSKGEKRNRKRMATVASVYTIQPFERTPEQIAKELGPVREVIQGKRPKPESKRVWASIQQPKEQVIEQLFQEAHRRDLTRQKQAVVLVDGEEKQLELLQKKTKAHGFDVTFILDLIHPLEYLWKAAYVFHPEASKAAEQWVNERLLKILQGNCRHVAQEIRESAKDQNISQDKRAPADKCADYLLKYQQMMRYDQYLKAGFPIATGVIEGACRYLVKDRMDRTGARWSLPGAEAVLQMRALVASGDFEQYWDFHTKQEYERNYDPVLRQTIEQQAISQDYKGKSILRVVK